ncbi:MAG: hypothetical protein V4537_14390 [Pseudomonadota bacterium]
MKKSKEKRTFAPSPAEVERRRKQGYAPAAALAAAHDVSASSVYNWASRWIDEGRMVGALPAAFKHLGHLWVLEAAVKAQTADPIASVAK